MSRSDVRATSHFSDAKESATASWQQCGIADAWNATVLLGRALRNQPRPNIAVDFGALVGAAIAVVEQERAASRPAPALA